MFALDPVLDESDVTQVLQRQDASYGFWATDENLWLSTVQFPFTERTGEHIQIIETHEALYNSLDPLERRLRGEGVRRLRTISYTNIPVSDNVAILTCHRHRIDGDGHSIGYCPYVWVLSRSTGRWLAREVWLDTNPEVRDPARLRRARLLSEPNTRHSLTGFGPGRPNKTHRT